LSESLLDDVDHVAPISAVVGTGRVPSQENWYPVAPLTTMAESPRAHGPEMIPSETPE